MIAVDDTVQAMRDLEIADETRGSALARLLEKQVVESGMKPGELIGTFDDLQARTGFARPTVSEAVRLLVDRGIATVKLGRNGGVYVAEQTEMVRLRRTLLNVHGSVTTIEHAIAVRDALEELVLVEAVRHRKAKDVRDLEKFDAQFESFSGGVGELIPLNWALHRRLAEITPNELLKATYLGTMQCIADMTSVGDEKGITDAYIAKRVNVHREIVRAVIDQDEEAATAALEAHNAL